MTHETRWAKLDQNAQIALEGQVIAKALDFLEAVHAKHSPELAARLKRKSVAVRAKKLLRGIVSTHVASVRELEAATTSERQKASDTADKFRAIQDLIDSIPDEHQSEIERYDIFYHNLLFSSDFYNLLSVCSVYFKKKSWKSKGRPVDIVMRNTTSACIESLEYITGKPFRKNFHTEAVEECLVFTNPDCIYCEIILRLFKPTLKHEEIKASLKMHFAPSRAKPVRHVGPSRKPIYGDPQKTTKQG